MLHLEVSIPETKSPTPMTYRVSYDVEINNFSSRRLKTIGFDFLTPNITLSNPNGDKIWLGTVFMKTRIFPESPSQRNFKDQPSAHTLKLLYEVIPAFSPLQFNQ